MSDDALQFESAEYEQPAGPAACGRCRQSLTRSYYQVNGLVVCQPCAEALRLEQTGGSRTARVLRAAAAGLGAAVLGALVYYAISALTGYEFGLIAIVVGFAVGAAVRWGSNGRGGWAYQGLAILLTYLAIVSTYVPPILAGLRDAERASVSAAPAHAGVAQATPIGQPAAEASRPTLRQFVLALALILVVACAAPFLAGFQNVIGIIIIAIGLYQAWKLNRRIPFEMTGPHPVTSAAAAV